MSGHRLITACRDAEPLKGPSDWEFENRDRLALVTLELAPRLLEHVA
jgi:hypothetical protein